MVNADEFAVDWAAGTLPNYAFFTPNQDDNAHDTDLPTASQWLQNLEPYLADTERMKDTLFFVTFDESHSYFNSNRIAAVALGPMVKEGSVYAARRNHFDYLKMVEDNFGLGTLDAMDDFARPMDKIFR